MTFFEFQNAFLNFPVIPLIEIEKLFPGFDRNALTRWQKKGYLEKVRNGFYRLTSAKIIGDANLFYIANRIYSPSYVSLQSALRWYDFIPEGVFTITSVTTKKTKSFETPEGNFSFKSLRKELFFGYQLEKVGNHYFKIASPEKAILDYLYLNSHLSSFDDLYELRLNVWELKKKLKMKELENFLLYFSSKALNDRTTLFKTYIAQHDDID